MGSAGVVRASPSLPRRSSRRGGSRRRRSRVVSPGVGSRRERVHQAIGVEPGGTTARAPRRARDRSRSWRGDRGAAAGSAAWRRGRGAPVSGWQPAARRLRSDARRPPPRASAIGVCTWSRIQRASHHSTGPRARRAAGVEVQVVAAGGPSRPRALPAAVRPSLRSPATAQVGVSVASPRPWSITTVAVDPSGPRRRPSGSRRRPAPAWSTPGRSRGAR